MVDITNNFSNDYAAGVAKGRENKALSDVSQD
jgi:hypothetical protein